MKIVIVVETQEDDRLHWPRIERGLLAYVARVRINNTTGIGGIDNVGCNGGPNTMIVGDYDPVTVTEVRVDRARLLYAIWGRLPWWLRWSVSWALPA